MTKVSKKRAGNCEAPHKQQSEQDIATGVAAPSSSESPTSPSIIVSVPLSGGIKEVSCPRFPAAILLGCVVSLLCAAGWVVCDYSRLAKLRLNEQESIDDLTRRNDELSRESAKLKSQLAQLSYRVRAAATRHRWLSDEGTHFMRAAAIQEAAEPLGADTNSENDEWTAWGDVEEQLPRKARSGFREHGGVGGSERSCSVVKGECKRQKSISKTGVKKSRGTFTRLKSSSVTSRYSKADVKPASLKISSSASQSTAFFMPTAGRITSHFGIRRSPFRRGRQMHEGMDIDCTTGAPIHAAGPGMVLAVGRHSSYGLVVDISHGRGIKTRYAHLSSALVRAGAPITRGTILGRCGSSGRSTGAHLHFEVHQNGSPVDPRRFLFRGNRVPNRSSQSIQIASSNKIDNRSKGTRRIG